MEKIELKKWQKVYLRLVAKFMDYTVVCEKRKGKKVFLLKTPAKALIHFDGKTEKEFWESAEYWLQLLFVQWNFVHQVLNRLGSMGIRYSLTESDSYIFRDRVRGNDQSEGKPNFYISCAIKNNDSSLSATCEAISRVLNLIEGENE